MSFEPPTQSDEIITYVYDCLIDLDKRGATPHELRTQNTCVIAKAD